MSSIAPHDDAVDDQENADGEQEMDPPRSVEYERRNCPYDEESNASDNADVHVSRW